jgi:hypothetical protein
MLSLMQLRLKFVPDDAGGLWVPAFAGTTRGDSSKSGAVAPSYNHPASRARRYASTRLPASSLLIASDR